MKLVKKMGAIILIISLIVSMIPESIVMAADYTALAVTLPLDGSWSSEKWITDNEKEQWYKIVLPADGELELRVMSYTSTDWGIYTQDMGESVAGGSAYGGNETSPVTEIQKVSLSAGTYYLKVHGYLYGYTGRYKVNTLFKSYNVNDQGADSYDSPKDLLVGSNVTGAITETDSEDWYRINITNTGYYHIKFVSYMSLEWEFSNSDLSNQIFADSAYGGDTEPKTVVSDIVLTKGTYYLKMHGYVYHKNKKGRYILSINKLSASNCDHEYKETDIGATYLAKGYTLHKCKKCGKTYKDNYIAKKVLNQGYIYSWGIMPGKKKIKVSYQGIYDVSGYQIRYSTNKKFKGNVKVVKVKKSKTTKTLTRLKKRKRYYIQVRGYKKIKGKTVYGKWSKKRSGKTK